MEADTCNDSFMIRIDFAKAFDSIDMGFLYKVMEKMGLPRKFVAMIKAMDSDVSAKVIINGAESNSFKVKRGTRQGDPLSLDKYIIASNPLLCALQNNRFVTEYISRSNKQFSTLAKADDLSFFTCHLSSVYQMKHMMTKFKKASGLAINVNKTKGFFFNRRNVHRPSCFPFLHWNENTIILGIPYGSEMFVQNFWKEKFDIFEKEAKYFQSY